MNEQRFPLFEDMHVLRTAALCSIRDQAFGSIELSYDGFSDGIISGCNILTSQSYITVNPGLVRFGSYMHLLLNEMRVHYEPTDEYCMLKIKFGMPEESESFLRYTVRLVLSNDMVIGDDEMELCRFKLKAGAVLRTKYVDFFDRVTEFDTVNIINSPYAAVGRSTLHPDITWAFAREAMQYRLEPLDQSFCMEALKHLAMSYEQIEFYLLHRLKLEPKEWDNMGFYQGLCDVLNEIRSGGSREILKKRRRRREVLVD
ncbi:MAG: hypothetical protein IKR28_06020 [Selenomonadaceae bacterium]|nr:hypothetical protein [Selenomonadaceae bacterium]